MKKWRHDAHDEAPACICYGRLSDEEDEARTRIIPEIKRVLTECVETMREWYRQDQGDVIGNVNATNLCDAEVHAVRSALALLARMRELGEADK